jgi:hypothetical protein
MKVVMVIAIKIRITKAAAADDLCSFNASFDVSLQFLQLPRNSRKPFLRPHILQRGADNALLVGVVRSTAKRLKIKSHLQRRSSV